MNKMINNKYIIFEDIKFYSNENFKKIRILHFNDAYSIDSGSVDPCGGASRFIHMINELINDEPALVFFSGDAFSPSLLSMFLKGKQMVGILNKCHINAACLGNHDFDFGVDVLNDYVNKSNYPWLLSNITDKSTNETLAGSEIFTVINYNGLKIGVIGIVEEEWISTLATIDYDELKYEDYLIAGKRLANHLKNEYKVDIVIALTHMRWPNDIRFAENAQEIDLFLGGHDHDYELKKVINRWVIKSGMDFRYLSLIELQYDLLEFKTDVSKIERISINLDIPEDPEIKKLITHYMDDMDKELDVVLGYMNTALDGRFSTIRSQETNLGNFICDIVRIATEVDCCLIQGGTFRSNIIHQIGLFRVRDLKAILPFTTNIKVLLVKGSEIHEALENGVSEFPKLEGRFPQVSGLKFSFDSSKSKGNRINSNSIYVNNEPIILNKEYKIAVTSFIANGKDGFSMFQSCPILRDSEYIPLCFNLVENYFDTIKKLKENPNNHHLCSSHLVPLSTVNLIIKNLTSDPTVYFQSLASGLLGEHKNRLTFKQTAKIIKKALNMKKYPLKRRDFKIIKSSRLYKIQIFKYEQKAIQLSPSIDGRIIHTNNNT